MKAKLAEPEPIVPVGPEVIEVSGTAVSTVQVRAASEPVLPAASVALTEKV